MLFPDQLRSKPDVVLMEQKERAVDIPWPAPIICATQSGVFYSFFFFHLVPASSPLPCHSKKLPSYYPPKPLRVYVFQDNMCLASQTVTAALVLEFLSPHPKRALAPSHTGCPQPSAIWRQVRYLRFLNHILEVHVTHSEVSTNFKQVVLGPALFRRTINGPSPSGISSSSHGSTPHTWADGCIANLAPIVPWIPCHFTSCLPSDARIATIRQVSRLPRLPGSVPSGHWG